MNKNIYFETIRCEDFEILIWNITIKELQIQ